MPTTITAQLPVLIDAGTRVTYPVGFGTGLGISPYSLFATEDDAPAKTFNAGGYNPVGAYSALATPDGDEIVTPALTEAAAIPYTTVRYTNGFSLDELAVRFLDPKIIPQWFRQLGLRAGECVSKAVYDLIRLGFTNSLFSATHASNVGNLSNFGSTALGHSSFAAARAVLLKQKSIDGDPAGQMGAFLVVPPDLEVLARQIVTSEVTDGSLQRNVLMGSVQVISSPFLTDATDWFMLAAKGENPFNVFWAIRPHPQMGVDSESFNLTATDSLAFAAGTSDWRGSFGAQVAG